MKGVLSVLCAAVVGAAALVFVPYAAGTTTSRVDLRVLVVSNGDSTVEAIAGELATEGVPYTKINLTDQNRPVITDGFLEDPAGGPRAKFQAVVLPNADPFGAGPSGPELTALAAFEKKFGIRQIDAYVYPNAAVGMSAPTYDGTLDGAKATLTAGGLTGPFRYLKGPVTFEDIVPNVSESYGYLATPLPDDPAKGTAFTSYLTAPNPNGGAAGTLAGVYTHDGRSELALTYAYNGAQWQFRTIAHGLITWMTKGVHLGYDRNYFEVHVDDVFLKDARWNVNSNCTAGDEGCSAPGSLDKNAIRMTARDAVSAAAWEARQRFVFDMLFNGNGSIETVQQLGHDPLLTAFQAEKSRFRWVNHTYEHLFVGCVQDFSVKPWRCVKNPGGSTAYMGRLGIIRQIVKNTQWAHQHGFAIDPTELVTGEHSGMRIMPQQPADNPFFASALTAGGIKWLGSDASRDNTTRRIGSAITQPRFPLATFYNVSTTAEEVTEYNWIYASKADGGSGLCTANPAIMTCIKPLDPKTGYLSYIVPTDTRIDLSHILGNDPRSHYAHQSNLAGDQLLYPLLDRILSTYRAAFAANTPITNLRMSQIGGELARQGTWKKDQGQITAYLQDGRLVINGGPAGLAVPVTVPGGSFGHLYAGERSGYETGGLTLSLPATG